MLNLQLLRKVATSRGRRLARQFLILKMSKAHKKKCHERMDDGKSTLQKQVLGTKSLPELNVANNAEGMSRCERYRHLNL